MKFNFASHNLEEIQQIIEDCERIQKNGGSSFSKEQAKVFAYDDIRYALVGNVDDEVDDE